MRLLLDSQSFSKRPHFYLCFPCFSCRYDVDIELNQLPVDFVSTLPAISTGTPVESADFREGDYFRGCLGEVRVGGVILPFFTQAQLANSTVARKFVMLDTEEANNVQEECVVCFEEECSNGGSCSNPKEVIKRWKLFLAFIKTIPTRHACNANCDLGHWICEGASMHISYTI